MKIKCFKQASTSVYVQEYDINLHNLDLCYTEDSYMSMFYKDCINKNVRLEVLSSDIRELIRAIGTDKITDLYDATFTVLHSNSTFTVSNSNSTFKIEQVFYPPKEKLLKVFCME